MEKRCEIKSHGIHVLLSNHKSIRKLKKDYAPSNHGHKVWPSSWLLIDYLKRKDFKKGRRILDIGCGWGLSGIFCAKHFKATVTCIDGDEKVYPYVQFLAGINKVNINFLSMEFSKIRRNILKHSNVIIGSDICFCETLINPLRRLIQRAKKAGVEKIVISDPGRWPFDDLSDLYINQRGTEVTDWQIARPIKTAGRILDISF